MKFPYINLKMAMRKKGRGRPKKRGRKKIRRPRGRPIKKKAAMKTLTKRTTKRKVYNDRLAQTTGGNKKCDLITNKKGVVVSKRRSQEAKKNLGAWIECCARARMIVWKESKM